MSDLLAYRETNARGVRVVLTTELTRADAHTTGRWIASDTFGDVRDCR